MRTRGGGDKTFQTSYVHGNVLIPQGFDDSNMNMNLSNDEFFGRRECRVDGRGIVTLQFYRLRSGQRPDNKRLRTMVGNVATVRCHLEPSLQPP